MKMVNNQALYQQRIDHEKQINDLYRKLTEAQAELYAYQNPPLPVAHVTQLEQVMEVRETEFESDTNRSPFSDMRSHFDTSC